MGLCFFFNKQLPKKNLICKMTDQAIGVRHILFVLLYVLPGDLFFVKKIKILGMCTTYILYIYITFKRLSCMLILNIKNEW